MITVNVFGHILLEDVHDHNVYNYIYLICILFQSVIKYKNLCFFFGWVAG